MVHTEEGPGDIYEYHTWETRRLPGGPASSGVTGKITPIYLMDDPFGTEIAQHDPLSDWELWKQDPGAQLDLLSQDIGKDVNAQINAGFDRLYDTFAEVGGALKLYAETHPKETAVLAATAGGVALLESKTNLLRDALRRHHERSLVEMRILGDIDVERIAVEGERVAALGWALPALLDYDSDQGMFSPPEERGIASDTRPNVIIEPPSIEESLFLKAINQLGLGDSPVGEFGSSVRDEYSGNRQAEFLSAEHQEEVRERLGSQLDILSDTSGLDFNAYVQGLIQET
jgi:hypothetical protein